jgi:hypothetical protein
MSGKGTIRVVLPDAGPLISLASAESLDLLLSFRESVRIVLTDVVHFEATHRSEDLPDAQAIVQFLEANPDRIDIIPTTVGSLALAEVRRKQQAGMPASLPRDIGELSITNFVISLRTANPGEPTLVIVEDDWFAANAYAVPGNVHLLSTSAWLDALEELKIIDSAAEVRSRIQARRPGFRAELLLDRQAVKLSEATDWRSAVAPRNRG